MKWSKFNYQYFSKTHNLNLLYNSLSNSFIKLEQEDIISAINSIKENIDAYDFSSNSILYSQLVNSKIITESDEMEILKIKFGVLNNRFSPFTRVITLLPTLDCNFKCPYCFEESGNKDYMGDEIENRIFLYLKNSIVDAKTTYINLCWMGGEPLLNYNRIISFSYKLNDLGIPYKANLITNGYLMTKEKIQEFKNLNISFVQVTIDGIELEHDKTRIHKKGKRTFDKIINNISAFYKEYPDQDSISLNIRVNLTFEENYIDKYIEIYDFLMKKFPHKNLFISPGFIKSNADDEKNIHCTFDRNSIKDFFIKSAQKSSLIGRSSYYPKNTLTECAVRSQYHIIIGPNAELYTCWDYIGKKKDIYGYINEDGQLQIKNRNAHIKYLNGADYLDDPNCQNCFFFPICCGGCPKERIENFYEGSNFDCCCIEKNNLDEILDCYYESKINSVESIS